jgi:hypothetical protein
MMWQNLYNSARWGGVVRGVYREIRPTNPHYLSYPGVASCQITTIAESKQSPRQKGLLVINDAGIAVYFNRPEATPVFNCLPGELRWFGRPIKYHPRSNEIWIHAEVAGRWQILKVSVWRTEMYKIVRSLKAIATPEQITAYRRRRPYIHYGPILTEPATQEITGEWVLEQPVTLYLTPAHLAILDGVRVLRTIPLEIVQRIGALHRLDAPQANGLARFQVEGETMAFSVSNHTALAEALAEAAKRTLEEPVLQKRKSKDDDFYEEEEWEVEQSWEDEME